MASEEPDVCLSVREKRREILAETAVRISANFDGTSDAAAASDSTPLAVPGSARGFWRRARRVDTAAYSGASRVEITVRTTSIDKCDACALTAALAPPAPDPAAVTASIAAALSASAATCRA